MMTERNNKKNDRSSTPKQTESLSISNIVLAGSCLIMMISPYLWWPGPFFFAGFIIGLCGIAHGLIFGLKE